MTTPERYILVKGKAGLGNRLLVLMGSMVYAELTTRKVLIDWRDGGYAPQGQNAFSLLFSSPDPGDLSRLSEVRTIAPAIWSGHLDESVEKFFSINYPENWEMDCNETVARQTTMDLAKPDYEEDIVVRWGWMHDLHLMRRLFSIEYLNHSVNSVHSVKGIKSFDRIYKMIRMVRRLCSIEHTNNSVNSVHSVKEFVRSNRNLDASALQYASMSDHDILKLLFRSQFKPEESLSKIIGEFRDTHFANHSVIGVHIRFSDRAEPYERYFPLVDQYIKRHGHGVVFLATDNCEIEKVFRTRYARVVTVEKWFPPAGTPIHRNRQPDKDALGNARSAVVELYLLGACNALVFSSTSTFGYVASLLSNAKSGDIVDLARGRTIKTVVKACAKWLRRVGRNFGQN